MQKKNFKKKAEVFKENSKSQINREHRNGGANVYIIHPERSRNLPNFRICFIKLHI